MAQSSCNDTRLPASGFQLPMSPSACQKHATISHTVVAIPIRHERPDIDPKHSLCIRLGRARHQFVEKPSLSTVVRLFNHDPQSDRRRLDLPMQKSHMSLSDLRAARPAVPATRAALLVTTFML
ncbi:hypothetical protein P3342_011251 [Pyrenophora teres f. teres]|nr:hypothetical protein P3342_011251 [Pyrenophora teres f. teres]